MFSNRQDQNIMVGIYAGYMRFPFMLTWILYSWHLIHNSSFSFLQIISAHAVFVSVLFYQRSRIYTKVIGLRAMLQNNIASKQCKKIFSTLYRITQFCYNIVHTYL